MSPPPRVSSRAEEASDSVLIVDGSPESREVLRTVLEGRGHSILEASAPEDGLRILKDQRPDVVVLDVEDSRPSPTVCAEFENESEKGATSLVLLGRAMGYHACPTSRVISKPYHYAPLIRTIEALLARA